MNRMDKPVGWNTKRGWGNVAKTTDSRAYLLLNFVILCQAFSNRSYTKVLLLKSVKMKLIK